MIRGLYTAVSGLITQEAKQDVITNNMANANTNGYKSDDLKIKNFGDVYIENRDRIAGNRNVTSRLGKLSYGSKIDETYTDFTQGDLVNTDEDTDFALSGSGFFTVQGTVNGKAANYYTRDGHFHVSNDGYLVNDSGYRVLGRNAATNALEPIKVDNSKMTVDANNNIYLDGRLAYNFGIVDFNNYNALQKQGDNLYSGNNPIAAQQTTVKQKSLEKSNVNIINSMVDMMSVMRNFESDQKVVQTMDETLGKAVNDVGKI
ncbi:flagellar hook-basal body complex protein [Clostridium oryzae]|uniref:Flagellar basal-body rod protein FlgG n=1 Tax=Clostridium oryzae TaxID=1450648 RepID=A0A1V4IV08_9CLOT|nr:flagellar hook-basal body complex protein [Clostridium oryzae]OPJ63257.1 flagellar basal-body rod protein FlgG [Clostridium oryzae]